MVSQNIDRANVRLSIELSRIYNRILQVVYVMDESSVFDVKANLMDIAEDIQETIGEVNLNQFESKGDMKNEGQHNQ